MNNDTFYAHRGFSSVGNIFFAVEITVNFFDRNGEGVDFDWSVIILTQEEKSRIIHFRQMGAGYIKIAQDLGLSVNTVKSFCRRNAEVIKEKLNCCKQCGIVLTQNLGRKEKKFCSVACRMKWWGSHSELMRHRKQIVCIHCGKSFYGKPGRKYCSHKCYIAERFGGNNVAQTV